MQTVLSNWGGSSVDQHFVLWFAVDEANFFFHS